MKTVNISNTVFCKLIPEHRKFSHVCIGFFRKIRHSVIPIFYKIRNQFRILSVILELAVVFDFLALFYSIWIHLDNADSSCDQPCSQCKPVVASRFKPQDNLAFSILYRKLQHPCFSCFKAFCCVAEFKCFSA